MTLLNETRLLSLLLLCSILLVFSDCTSKGSQVIPILATIPIYPNSTEVSHDQQIRQGFPRFAFAHTEFKARVSYDELKRFYVEKLISVGWQLEGDRINWHKGQNLGGHLLIFRKGEYKAEITYAGEKAYFGWDYQITVSWNID